MENLKKVFETISKEELSSYRDGMDYEIILKTKKIKPSSLILTRSKEQEIIKEYLNEIMKKEWIRINKLLIIVSLFLMFKPKTDKKRSIMDNRKLNKEIVTDSILLLLIKDIIN